MPASLSVIIVNFNTANLVQQAVESIYKFLNEFSFEIIIVDNASTKGSLAKSLQSFPKVQIIYSPENIGFGRANNLGFKHAEGNFVFLLNSDAYLIDDTSIPLMMKYLLQHKDVGIVGPNFIKADGTKNYAYGNLLGWRKQLHDVGLWKIPDNKFSHYATFKTCDVKRPIEVGYLAAAGILIKRSVIEDLGLFDPNFFLYFEDMELGWRYKKAGFKNVLLPEATIVHLGGGSGSSISKDLHDKITSSKNHYIRKRFGAFHFYVLYIASTFLLSLKRLKRGIS